MSRKISKAKRRGLIAIAARAASLAAYRRSVHFLWARFEQAFERNRLLLGQRR